MNGLTYVFNMATKKEMQKNIDDLKKDIYTLLYGSEKEKFNLQVYYTMLYKIDDSLWNGDTTEGIKIEFDTIGFLNQFKKGV